MHLQEVHSANGFCNSRSKTLRLQQRFYSRTNRASLEHQHSQRTCVWSDENPHAILHYHPQRQFSANLWAGILGGCLISPHILPARISGRDYLNFLWTHVNGLLADVSFKMPLHTWFQHDGAPPHYNRELSWALDWPRTLQFHGLQARLAWIISILSFFLLFFQCEDMKNKSVPVQ
jgi:hypothetical protein